MPTPRPLSIIVTQGASYAWPCFYRSTTVPQPVGCNGCPYFTLIRYDSGRSASRCVLGSHLIRYSFTAEGFYTLGRRLYYCNE